MSSVNEKMSLQSFASSWLSSLGSKRPGDAFLQHDPGIVKDIKAKIHEGPGERGSINEQIISGRCRPRGRTISVATLSFSA